MIPDALTVRRLTTTGPSSLSQDQFNQLLANAIEADPTLVIRALPAFTEFTGGVDQEIFFVDNPLVPEESGVYAVSDDRGINKISTT